MKKNTIASVRNWAELNKPTGNLLSYDYCHTYEKSYTVYLELLEIFYPIKKGYKKLP